MKYFEVTKELSFCAGHRVPSHSGKCRNAHGHGYLLKVTARGPLVDAIGTSSEGMVVDFSELKKAMVEEVENRFDHVFIKACTDRIFNRYDQVLIEANKGNELLAGRWQVEDVGIVQEIRMIPTAENLAYIIFKLLEQRLNNADTRVTKVQLWETPTSMAEYSE